MNIFTKSSKPISLHNIHDKLVHIMNKQEISILAFRKYIKEIYTHKFNNTVAYWVERGYGETEAKQKVHSIMSDKAKKLHFSRTSEERKKIAKNANEAKQKYIEKLKKENPQKLKEQFTTNIEYYLSRGMNRSEAETALKERQATFSKEKMIHQYGETIGLKKVKERNDRWLATMKSNNDWDEISSRKGRTYEQLVKKFGNDRADKIINDRSRSFIVTFMLVKKIVGNFILEITVMITSYIHMILLSHH
jgi:hypothetical protein